VDVYCSDALTDIINDDVVAPLFTFSSFPRSSVGMHIRDLSYLGILDRITVKRDQCGGKPCIRNMRSGMSHQEILDDYPYLEEEDISAVLTYAAR